MKNTLFSDLMRFANSKKTTMEKVQYIFLGLAFYFSLSKTFSSKNKNNSSSSEVATGDDIYPLF